MISVLLPFRNTEHTIDDAIRSVLDDLDPGDEIVLVDDDDAGADASSRARAEVFARTDPRVRISDPATNPRGIAGALTYGLTLCRGDLIARMDADDISLPGRFAAQRRALIEDPSLGAIATQIEAFGDPKEGILRYIAWQNSLVTASEHENAIFIEAPICHPSTMIRRSALDAVGGYRSGPFAEDYDLWLRLIAAGHAIAKIPRVLFRWRIHAGMTTMKNDPRLSDDAFLRLRAEHLATKLGEQPFAIWGAGPAGRRLARELETTHGKRASFFIDIDPKKIGRTRRGLPVLSADEGSERARNPSVLVIVAVATLGARDLIRTFLAERMFVEGTDFLCAI